MISFYDIVGIPSTLIDLDGNIITCKDGRWVAAGWQDICLNFHRKHPETLKKCIKSDTEIFKGLKSGEKYACNECPNGLVDMAVPVYVGGKHLANLFTGQFFFKDPDIEFFKKQAEKYGFNGKEYLNALSKVPVFSKEFIEKSVDFLNDLASIIGEMGLEKKKLLENELILQESEKYLRDLFNNPLAGFALHEIITDDNGIPIDYVFLVVNDVFEELTGLKADEIINKRVTEVLPGIEETDFIEIYGKVALKGESIKFEQFTPQLNKYYEIAAFSPRKRLFATLFTDITERKHAEQERETTIEFLHIVNGSKNTRDLIQKAIKFFQKQSDCEAVGIRMKKGNNYPYYESRGFSEEFVLLENELCERDKDGNIIYDTDYNPVIECMCGNVICGRFDPSKPFFTTNGSFWTNSTTELLANTSDEDRQARTRNRCNGEGYESVALIPLYVGKQRLGLLQLNDFRKEMFSPGIIALLERLANYLAVALAKFKAEEQKQNLLEEVQQFAEELQATTEELQITNEELRIREKRLREFFDNPLNGFALCEIITDDKGEPVDFIYLDVNDAFETFTGLKREEVLDKRVKEILDPEEVEDIIKIYGNVALTGETADFEYSIPSLGKYYEFSAFSPKKGQFIAFFTDITESKKVAKILEESEKKYREVFNKVNDMISLNIMEENRLHGKFIEINDIGIQRLGYTKEELLNMGPVDIVAPDKRPEMPKNAAKLYEKGHNTFEIVHITKDGKRIPVEVNNHLIQYDGQEICLAVSRDITERKKADEALRLYSIYNRSLIEASLDPLVTIGPDGKITDVNSSTEIATGYSRDELVGTDFSDYFTKPEKAREGYKKVFREGLVRDYPLEIQNKNGNITSVLYNASIYRNEHGEVIGVFAAARDITDLKKAENEIKESLREKEILLREIHHRVKNNLQIVSSLLSLQTEYVDEKESIDVLKESRNRVQTMSLVHEELYKSSSLKDINFKGFIESLVSNLFYSYGVKIGTIERQIDVENLNIGIDTAVPCGLIINELVTNSLKYAFPDNKGTIKIEFKDIQGELNLIISDNGVGMPENVEIEDTETLGLKMVNSLVDQLDGTLELNIINGTEFKIIFKELEYKDRI